MKNLTAKDIMSSNVTWIPADWPLSEAVAFFAKEKISGAPVVDDNGAMVGVVSLKDLIGSSSRERDSKARESEFYDRVWEKPMNAGDFHELPDDFDDELLVSDVMTPMVFSVSEDASITELAETMLRGRIHRLVVTRDEELTGIVTTMDMLKVIRDYS